MSSVRPEEAPQNATVLSLFTGAGGLDIGLEAAGFAVVGCVEIDGDARETLSLNRPDWPLIEPSDVHELDPSAMLEQLSIEPGDIDLLAGGPPCQPFSKSANWTNPDSRGLSDPRSTTLQAYLKVVEVVQPKVILLENVRGLAAGQANGLQLLCTELSELNRRAGTRYRPHVIHLNAVDYGVPQRRERLFVLATSDGQRFDPPLPTHGDGEDLESVRTAWDAIGDLDTDDWPQELMPRGKWADLLQSIPEGHNYLWHTPNGDGEPIFGWRTRYWSFLLKLSKQLPSWTIQAAPGPATGPFHWRNRLLSVRELARLQTFPDSYNFVGDRRSAQRQIGNAVPCALAEVLGMEVRSQLLGLRNEAPRSSLAPKASRPIPDAHPAKAVPARYNSLKGDHQPHPGTGKGPGRQFQESVTSD